MKYLKIILLTTLVVLGACKKDKEDIEKGDDLSYVDKYSKGTVSFTIDGKKYTKEFKTETKGLLLMKEESYAYYSDKYKDDMENTISISVGFDDLKSVLRLTIGNRKAHEVGKYTVGIDKEKSSQFLFTNNDILYSSRIDNGCFVNVTKYDYDKRIIEGEFEAKLLKGAYEKDGVKIIKNGKFSLVFTLW